MLRHHWTSARLHRRLDPDAMVGWFNDWLQRGEEVTGGVPHARTHRQQMGVMLHQEEYGATAGWSRMRQNVINKMSETSLAYTYIRLYLVIMDHLRANAVTKVHKGYSYAEFYEDRHNAHVRNVQTSDDEAEIA